MRTYGIVIAIAAVSVLAGCGPKSNDGRDVKVYGKDGNVTISGNGEHVTVKSSNGQASVEINGSDAKLPDFAPLYPGATVTSSFVGSGGGDGHGGMASFETGAAAADVIAFYKRKAAAAGLVDKMDTAMGGSLMFVAGGGDDKKGFQVIAVKSGTGTRAQVTWSDK